MAHCNANLCGKTKYCEFGAYCKKVIPGIHKELLKNPNQPTAIKIKIFKQNGSGANCTQKDSEEEFLKLLKNKK